MTLIKFRNGLGLRSFPAIQSSLSMPSFFTDSLERMLPDEEVSWMPSVNVRERAEDFKIDIAIPGMGKDDVKVEVDNNTLTVSGERKDEALQEHEIVTRREFHYGTFNRVFSLPDTADAAHIHASYNNGILTLLVAKRVEARPQPKRQIDIA
jgi:HSP20 family protein